MKKLTNWQEDQFFTTFCIVLWLLTLALVVCVRLM
jgi:hypothetical protein